MTTILHMVEQQFLPNSDDKTYTHKTLKTQGFIHCSTPSQVAEVANYIYESRDDIFLLIIDEDKVSAEIKYEDAGNGELYPHIYGVLNMDAVSKIIKYNLDANSAFTQPNLQANTGEDDETPKQFTHPLLVEAYDAINALDEDAIFWLKEADRLQPNTVIDFGCGTGLLTCELVRKGYRTIGIDPAGPMIDIAKTKPDADQIEWLVGDYTALKNISADLLLMTSHVAQFLLTDEEWQGMLKNAHTVLDDDGYILFDSRQSLEKSFAKWPTIENKRKMYDENLGDIEYWCDLKEVKDNTAHYQLHYDFKEKDEVVVSHDAIIFRPKQEIIKSLKNAGFVVEKIYGSWDGSECDDESPEMIFLAKKA